MINSDKTQEDYTLSDQDVEQLNNILEERRNNCVEEGPWNYTQGDVPESIQGPIGARLIDYILNEDRHYISSRQISEDMEDNVSPKQIGSRIRLIGQTLGLRKDEIGLFTRATPPGILTP